VPALADVDQDIPRLSCCSDGFVRKELFVALALPLTLLHWRWVQRVPERGARSAAPVRTVREDACAPVLLLELAEEPDCLDRERLSAIEVTGRAMVTRVLQ
jgi:hypothetical protein